MNSSAFTAPHATQFLTVDVTKSLMLVEQLCAHRAFDGRQVALLLLVGRALLAAAPTHSEINTSWRVDSAKSSYRCISASLAAVSVSGAAV